MTASNLIDTDGPGIIGVQFGVQSRKKSHSFTSGPLFVKSFNLLVRAIGLEPTLPLQELEPKSSASASFATPALLRNTLKVKGFHESRLLDSVAYHVVYSLYFTRFSLADF
jgi:hypothetical protein